MENNIKEKIKKLIKLRLQINLIDQEEQCNERVIAPYILDVEDFCKKCIGMDALQQNELEKRILQLEIYKLENELQSIDIEKEDFIRIHGEVINEIRSKLEI